MRVGLWFYKPNSTLLLDLNNQQQTGNDGNSLHVSLQFSMIRDQFNQKNRIRPLGYNAIPKFRDSLP